MAKSQSFIDKVGNFGTAMEVGGMFTGLVNNYFAGETEKYELQTRGLNFKHQQAMSAINADAMEFASFNIYRQYAQQKQNLGIDQRQKRGKRKVSVASRGGKAGYGSTRDVEVSRRVLDSIDRKTIDVNRVKAANDMKTRGINARIQSDMLGVSAGAMFSSANNVSGFMNAAPSLLTGVSSLAQNFVKRNA